MKVFRLVLFLSLIAIAAVAIWHKKPSSPPAVDLPTYGQVGEFALTDSQNQSFGSAQLRNSVWIVNFIFTRCQGPCPLLTEHMAGLQTTLAALAGVKQVTISIDPEYDTPEVLAAYAEQHGANPQRWHFLTGDKEKIIAIARSEFKLSADDNPDLHTTTFVLVDKDMTIRGYHDGKDEKAIGELVEKVKLLAGK